MKKSLVALAVAAALPAFAQAQTSVQLIGSVDVSVESLNKDANGGQSDLKISDGRWGGSRVGIVGSEELGNGTKAIFNLEYRARADTGRLASERFWHGQSWVGLTGGFGTVKLGRQYTPVDAVQPLGDALKQSWYYSSDGMAGVHTKLDNAVSYATPSLGGMTFAVAYGAGEQEATGGIAGGDLNKLNDAIAVGLMGEWGMFSAGLAYQTFDGAKINNIKSTDQLAAALGVTLGRFKAGLTYGQSEEKRETGASPKRKAFQGSMSFQTSDTGTVYLSYLRDDPQGEKNNTDGIGLVYSHGLSKRTYIYGAAGIGKEQQGTGAEDSKPRRFAIGLRHFF